MQTNVIRRISIQATAQGVAEAAGQLDRLAAAQGGVAVASDTSTRSTLSVERAYERLARTLDRDYQATREFERAQRTLNQAMEQGLVDQTRYGQLIDLAAERQKRMAASTGAVVSTQARSAGAVNLNAGQVQNLTFQLNDMATMLASGQNPFVMMMQQGMQMAQVFGPGVGVGAALKATGAALVGFLTNPLTLAVVGIAAVSGAVSWLWSTVSDSGGADSALERHKALIDRIRDAYGEAGEAATTYQNKAIDALEIKDHAVTQLRDARTALDAELEDIRSLVDFAVQSGQADAVFGPLVDQVTEFQRAIEAGNPDIEAFKLELLTLKDRTDDQTFDDLADDVLDLAAAAFEAFVKVQELAGGLDVVAQSAAKVDAAMKAAGGDRLGGPADRQWFIDQADAEKSAQDAVRTAQQRADAIAGVSDELRFEADQLARTAREQAIYNALRQAGTTLDTEAGRNIADLAGNLYDAEQAQDAFNDKLKDAKGYAAGFFDTFLGGLTSGEGLVASLGDAVGGLASKLGGDLLGNLGTSIGGGVGSMLGSILGPLGSALGNAAGSLLGDLFDSIFGDNDEEERLRRKEERARRQEARDRREAKLEAKEDARLAREEKRLAKQEASARRVESFEDRAFSAGLDTTTLEGQLAQFDREAQREREELARTAGKKYNKEVIALDKALAAERLQIQEDFNDELVAEAKRAQDEINQVARSIVDYVNGLNTGSGSTLSPQDRLTAAQAAYNSQLALAQGGNVDAQSSITQYADDFLNAAREMYASSTAFQDIFSTVKAQLLALPAVQQADDPVVVALLQAQDAIVSAVDLMRTTLNAAINAGPAATAAAMAPNFENIDVNVDGGITLAEMQTALGTTNTKLQSIFTTLDADGNGTISKLELIRAQAVATNTNTSNTATRVNGVAKDTSLTSPTKGLPKVADATALTLPQQLENLNVAIVVLQQLIGGLSASQTTLFKNLIKAIKNSPNYATGGMIPAYDAGGMVGNGIYNVDSVRARYAGGGDIMLAGGEFVTRATSVNAMTMPILDAINRTGRPAGNDNGGVAAMTNVIHADFGNLMRVQLSAMRALIETLQSENAMLRAEVRSGSERTTRAVKDKPVAKPQAKRA